jgi:hypothetical protein
MIAKDLAKVMKSIVLFLMLLSISLSYLVPIKTSFAIEINSIEKIVNNSTKNLSDEIKDIVSASLINGTINGTGNIVLSNTSGTILSQIVMSTSNISTGNFISNKVISKNGICSSDTVGGSGNDTLSSNGKCNDQLTGGLGADKFVCGQGTDTVRDFNSEEGDIIIDPQNCEKIL